jgi:hypothetical protein
MAPAKRYDPQVTLRPGTKESAIEMALSDIHLLRMLARVSGGEEVKIIMKGYGYDLTNGDAQRLAQALTRKLTMTVQELVALFNSLEVPKSIPSGVTAPFRGKEWGGPPARPKRK